MAHNIVILTGAGVSAESGLGTFRDTDGLWTQYDLNAVATPEGFARNPALVHEFYNARRANCVAAQPNQAHVALARLVAEYPGQITLVTQNVDDLHERGGARNVLHMHGTLSGALCGACDSRWDAPEVMSPDDSCPRCGACTTRPDIVWFGEIPYGMDLIMDRLAGADIFAAIGTSGEVYPAAGFVHEAARQGAHRVELNLEPTGGHVFDEVHQGKASETVPAWVDTLLRGIR